MIKRKPGQIKDDILDHAEELMSGNGYKGVSMRDIAMAAGVNLGSVTYHFGTKENLLSAIYAKHTRPMNLMRLQLLGEAERISNKGERLSAIVRAYVLPTIRADADGGGARFTRLRAVLSMEGHSVAKKIIADAFDDTTRQFIRALMLVFPNANKQRLVWRCHFLLGALYYTLVDGDRVQRLLGTKHGVYSMENAVAELIESTTASLAQLAFDSSVNDGR